MSLFSRTRQRVVLTDVGRLYASQVRATLAELSDATRQAIALSGTSGVLNLAVLPTFGTRWLIPRIPDFFARHPDVTVNFGVRLVPFDFAAEPFDAAIHFGQPHWPGAVCELLMTGGMRARLQPSLSRAGADRRPAGSDAGDSSPAEHALDGLGRMVCKRRRHHRQSLRGPRFEQFAMVAQAAVAGLGVGADPAFPDRGRTRIRAARDAVSPQPHSSGAYYLVYPDPKAEAPLVRSFRDWIIRPECRRLAITMASRRQHQPAQASRRSIRSRRWPPPSTWTCR